MTSTAALHRFCFAQACVFVVPAEALGEHGADTTWADAAVGQGRLSPQQLRCLERGFALYWQRAGELRQHKVPSILHARSFIRISI